MESENAFRKVKNILEENAKIKIELSKHLGKEIVRVSELILEAYRNGGKVIIFGNGGSAADAQHMASELVGRFMVERRGLPAIALNTDSSVLTAISNDYGFDKVFSRQIEALANNGDIVIAISTSGKSKNVLEAVKTAREKKAKIIGFTGESGGELVKLADINIGVPSKSTPRIQEAHITIIHIICELVEQGLIEE